MNGVRVGLGLARERLRGLSAPVVLSLLCVALFAIALLERRSNAVSAPDDALGGAVFGIALPLIAYLVSERVCDGTRLDRSVDCVARYGANRRAALFGVLLASAVASAFAAALMTIAALLGAHPPQAHALVADLRASVGIALVAGAVYALYFGAASLLGKRGGGRKWALIIDFVLGAGGSALAAPWPRGHVRNLLGGQPVVDLTQASAWLALALIGMVCATASVARTAE
ncbi:MAG TPA: hypothetical protein VER96_30945 [Polyangiaceae bacterium]|nr:hypothetical protein [Polyangiaceae bacterium]